MMRSITILWAILASAIGVGLFMLKYEVRSLEQRLATTNRQIYQEKEAIHVLNAEWSYLNDPGRLRELSERHLGLKAVQPMQIAAIDAVPMAEPRSAPPSLVAAVPAAPTKAPPTAAATTPAAVKPAPAGQPAEARPTPPRPAYAPARIMEAKVVRPASPVPQPTPVVATPPRPRTTSEPDVATRPALPQPAPMLPARLEQQADVLVIKSPALLQAEYARGGGGQ